MKMTERLYHGWMPLKYAKEYNQEKISELLIEHGAKMYPD